MKKIIRFFGFCLFLAALSPAFPQSPAVRGMGTKAGSAYLATDIAITLNPNRVAPLVAIAEFTTRLPCNVGLEVQGEIPVTRDFQDNSTAHTIPIVGLYPGRVNTVVFTLYRHHGTPEIQTLSITTAPLPDTFPVMEVNTSIPALTEPGWNLMDFAYTTGTGLIVNPFIFDPSGQIRWYMDLSATPGQAFPFERMANRNFVFGAGSSIYEYDIMGKLQNKLTVPGYVFHHDIREMPDGSLIAAVNKAGTQIINSTGLINSIEDDMIQINRTTGAVMGEWDMRALLDVDRNEVINKTGDWFHMNGIWYSASDDCFIISGRHQGVVKVTRGNKLKWILAARDGWGNAGYDGSGPDTTPFLLAAVDGSGNPYYPLIQSGFAAAADFDWTWGQHNPMLLANGHYFIFDNGFRRWFSDVTGFFSRGVEYIIDDRAMTVREVWQYGKERELDLYSTIISSVDDMPLTHNRLINPGIVQLTTGSYAKIVEVTYPGKQVVFEATARFKNLLSQGTANGGFDLVYRSRRVSILP